MERILPLASVPSWFSEYATYAGEVPTGATASIVCGDAAGCSSGRYIYIQRQANNYFALCEAEVYGKFMSPVIKAIEKLYIKGFLKLSCCYQIPMVMLGVTVYKNCLPGDCLIIWLDSRGGKVIITWNISAHIIWQIIPFCLGHAGWSTFVPFHLVNLVTTLLALCIWRVEHLISRVRVINPVLHK